MEHIIEINNCNNIKKARISLEEGTLNIKYGYNGTGKTTICEAIRLKAEGGDLNVLVPYSNSTIDKETDTDMDSETEGKNIPWVGDMPFNTVKVFDDSYIHQYLLKQDHVFEDSFRVFLKSEKCNDLAGKIDNMLFELQHSVFQGESIKELADTLGTFFKIMKPNENGLTKRGGVGEVVKGCGAGFGNYPDLDKYRPYYTSTIENVSKWAVWRTEGIKNMHDDLCPFCANDLEKNIIDNENGLISKVFKKSALETANGILKYLNNGIDKGYISSDSKDYINSYLGDATKEKEMFSELNHLYEETHYLYSKLNLILNFRPMNVNKADLKNIEDSLNNMKIAERQISKYYATETTKKLISDINGRIDTLLENTNKLKELFFSHDAKLNELIENRMDDINQFLKIAGFPYDFEIKKDGENKSTAFLKPIGGSNPVDNLDQHLSWGEMHAFALVMFMFDAVSENADLIVLDDPISSFDANKKFAVVRRMFDKRQEVTFKDKTVLMLTHDLQPVIDYVHGEFFERYNLTTQVSAQYLENVNGEINSEPINKDDLLNVVTLTEKFAKGERYPLYVRIINARKYIELTSQDYKDKESYDLLSNLIHGRGFPEDATKTQMTNEALGKGIENLKSLIDGYNSYGELLGEVTTEYLLDESQNNENIYYRILAIRIIFIRIEGLMAKLKKEYPGTCKFLNELNHIENDYVFQLNPERFFSIPKAYVSELGLFINKHRRDLGMAVVE